MYYVKQDITYNITNYIAGIFQCLKKYLKDNHFIVNCLYESISFEYVSVCECVLKLQYIIKSDLYNKKN